MTVVGQALYTTVVVVVRRSPFSDVVSVTLDNTVFCAFIIYYFHSISTAGGTRLKPSSPVVGPEPQEKIYTDNTLPRTPHKRFRRSSCYPVL
jgi:hypothetical protein